MGVSGESAADEGAVLASPEESRDDMIPPAHEQAGQPVHGTIFGLPERTQLLSFMSYRICQPSWRSPSPQAQRGQYHQASP